MNDKYELVKDDYIDYEYMDMIYRLYRIRAKKDFTNDITGRHVSIGDLGGYIYDEFSLLGDNSWVFDNAKLIGTYGSIFNNSAIFNNAVVIYSRLSSTVVSGDACVYSSALTKGGIVTDFAVIKSSTLYKHVELRDFCEVNNTVSSASLTMNGSVIITNCEYRLPEHYFINGDIVLSEDNSKILKITDGTNGITIIKTTEGRILWNRSGYDIKYTPMPEDHPLYQYAKEIL